MVKLGKNHPYVQLTKNSVCCRPSQVINTAGGYEFKTTIFFSDFNNNTYGLQGTTNYSSKFFIRQYWNYVDGKSLLFTLDNDGYLFPSVNPVDGNWEVIFDLSSNNTINPAILTLIEINNPPISITNDYYSSINEMPGVKLNKIPDIVPINT